MKKIYHNIFRISPRPSLVLLPIEGDFRIADANNAYLAISQSTLESLEGKTLKEFFKSSFKIPSDASGAILESLFKVKELLEEDIIPQLCFDSPFPGTSSSPEKYWTSENLPVLNPSGDLEYILHTLQDITPRVLSQKREEKITGELTKNQQQYQYFIEKSENGYYSLDLAGNFKSGNEGLARILEVDPDTLLKMNLIALCSEGDLQTMKSRFQSSILGEATKFEAIFFSAKDREVILEISLVPMQVNGKIIGVNGIAKNLTEIRKTEKVVVEKRNFLQANAAFIHTLLENEPGVGSLEDAFATIGNAVQVDRMYYFGAHSHPETGEAVISQLAEWTSEDTIPQIDNPEMQNLPAHHLEQMMGTLRKNQPFTVTLSGIWEGGLKEIFLEQEIKSMLLLPIILKETLHGFIGFDDCKREREWSEDEINFLKSLAHSLTNSLEKQAAEAGLKEQEKALKLSEQKFKALVQEGSDLLAILDIDGNYTFASETTTSILGTPPKELLGKNVMDFIHPEDRPLVLEQFATLKENEQLQFKSYRFRDQEGSWRWLETNVTKLTKDPAVQGVVTNSRDITAFLDQAQEIKEINERYRLAANATQDLIYDWDLQNEKVTRFYKNNSNYLGYTLEEVDRRDFWRNHIHPEELQEILEQQKAALADSKSDSIFSQYRFGRADGSYAYVIDRAYIIRNSEGAAIRMVGATSDISELKAKEKALKIANTRFKMAMKATSEIIWDWDIATDLVERSKAFKKVFGYKASNFPSVKSWLSKINEKDRERVQTTLFAALKDPQRKKWKETYSFKRANGKMAHVVDRCFILRDKKGKATRIIGSILDMTDSQNAMKKIETQNKLLKEIAWEQSHIVRAPLVRLQGLLHYFETEEYDGMGREEIWKHIYGSTEELDAIIKGIVMKAEELA